MKKTVLKVIGVLLLCTVLVSCSPTAYAPKNYEIYALDTLISFTVYSPSSDDSFLSAKSEIYRLEEMLSVTNSESDVYKLNSSPDTWVEVSEETFELIEKAIDISKKTDGRFDITVFPAVRLWGFTTSKYKVPSDTDIVNTKELIDTNNIILDKDGLKIKLINGAQIDLGAIAKGYIADKAADTLKAAGVTSTLMNFGGNVRTIGLKESNEKWCIGILTPFDSNYFATVNIGEGTSSTAGGYQRYFEIGGEKYHHIIDPSTASPSDSDALSVTVFGADGAVCDALATSLFVGGSNCAKEVLSEFLGYSAVILTEDAVFVSENLESDFELSESHRHLDIIHI